MNKKRINLLQLIKNYIKINYFTKILYSKLQCLNTKIKYMYLKVFYSNDNSQKVSFEKMKIGKNILYIGTDELQDKSGFLQELELFCNLKVFTKYDNTYGQYSEKKYKEGFGRNLNTQRLEDLLNELQHKNWIPDVILTQTWARLWNIDKLKELKLKYGFKFINIAMDDRHSFLMFSLFKKYNRGTSGLVSILDATLVTSKESIFWYHRHNVPAIYFPEATSSKFFYKIEDISKEYDVGFVGAKYGLRGEYIQYLVDKGINVKAYGNGWKAGRINNDDVNLFFNKCKIVIGFGYILSCTDFMALKLRDFDVPATGSLYLTTYNKDLKELFPEKKDCYFSSKEDLFNKVKYFLDNEELREQIAKDSYINTMNNHLYSQRFKLLFKD